MLGLAGFIGCCLGFRASDLCIPKDRLKQQFHGRLDDLLSLEVTVFSLGSRVKGQGSRVKGQGSRVKGQWSMVKGQVLEIKDIGSRVKGQGSRVKGKRSRDED